jgi:predicted nucleotidyltransferase component of viral defense system
VRAPFPSTFAEISGWAQENRMLRSEARVRFAQYAILRGIASSRYLRDALVFKGGNALDFVWMTNRSTRDLDFSVDAAQASGPLTAGRLREILIGGLITSGRELDVTFAVLRLEQQPPGADKTFTTFHGNVQYALTDDLGLRTRMSAGETIAQVVPVDISLNEPICDSTALSIGDNRQLRVSTIEDIVAEKLRALLQQPLRNRRRPQDVLDVAVIVRERPTLDVERVGSYLLRKAAARNVRVSRAAFRAEEISARARIGYAALERTTRTLFIPFDEAWAEVERLVARIAIPAS